MLTWTYLVIIVLANFECATNYARCGGVSPTGYCIGQFQLCDGVNDCGNNWDEKPEICGLFACRYFCTVLTRDSIIML